MGVSAGGHLAAVVARRARDEDDVVLVDGDVENAVVVEEDKDLVILEHVTVDVPEPEPESQRPLVQFPIPQNAQSQVAAPQTPRRRLNPRASLHRAVLIRSAQRTAMKVEMEKEEEGDGKSKVAMQEIPLRAWAAGSGSSIDLPSAI